MNKFIVKPNKTLEEIKKLNKKSRIVLEPKERFIKPYKEFDFEKPYRFDYAFPIRKYTPLNKT
jgi:hypothetical protein